MLVTSPTEGTISIVATRIEGVKISSERPAQRTILADSVRPSAVAYDPLEQRVYWSDVALNRIYRIFLNGTFQETFSEELIGTVDGIAIDWNARTLFFSNVIPLFDGQSKGLSSKNILFGANLLRFVCFQFLI